MSLSIFTLRYVIAGDNREYLHIILLVYVSLCYLLSGFLVLLVCCLISCGRVNKYQMQNRSFGFFFFLEQTLLMILSSSVVKSRASFKASLFYNSIVIKLLTDFSVVKNFRESQKCQKDTLGLIFEVCQYT